ncbi:hypothetical protein [Lacticaseibacillus kribbianus]|uniref:hypothetical protein n=1 Tax=Lacticaseibacillus kribbianus TaxID=2926292 RepID=UPI001CD7DF00|nr:hypothetical protein [Lacticaseibacillus kribbianus]
MIERFRLELRKQPWLVHVAAILGLLLLFAVPLGHAVGLLTTQYTYVGGRAVPSYRKTSFAAAYRQVLRERAAQEADLVMLQKQVPEPSRQAAIDLLRRIEAPLRRQDFLQVNRLTLAALKQTPAISDNRYLGDFLEDSRDSHNTTRWEMTTKRLQVYVDHHINALLTIDAATSATVAVYRVLARYGTYPYKWAYINNHRQDFYKLSPGTALLWIFLCYAALTLALAFSYDQRAGTASLMRITPVSELTTALIRGATGLALIAASLLVLLGGALAVNALLPGHRLGTLAYPLVVVSHSSAQVYPVWQYYMSTALVLGAWAVLLSGVAFLASLFVRNIIGMGALCALSFALVPLHVLDVFPENVQHLMPASYTNPPAMFAQAYQFHATQPADAYRVLLVWAAVAWLAGAAVLRLRTRRSGPWLN